MSTKYNPYLIKVAKNTDITKLPLNFKSEGSSFRCIEHNSLIFTKSTEGFWMYTWFNKGLQGDIIHFIMNHLDMKFFEAVEYLTGEKLEKIEINTKKNELKKPIHPTKEKNIIEFNFPKTCNDKRRAIAYLTKTRCINYNIVKKLIQEHQIEQDDKGNIVFVWHDENKNTIGAELKGTLTHKVYKHICPGSDNRYGFSLQIGQPLKVAFFESVVDLLSFYTLYPKVTNVILVSMAGLKMECINNYKELYPKAELIICVDNEEEADDFITRNNLDKYKRVTPRHKDFNEDLLEKHNKLDEWRKIQNEINNNKS